MPGLSTVVRDVQDDQQCRIGSITVPMYASPSDPSGIRIVSAASGP